MPPYTKDHQPPSWLATTFPYLVYASALAGTFTRAATLPRGLHYVFIYIGLALLLGGVYAMFGIGHTPPVKR